VLDVATQVVWGAEDRIIPAAHAQALSDAAKVHVLEGAGHMVHMEKASEVNAMIETLVID
jgi:pyruvate dehydrogenase E2 component (dihydrolipoamide acetyltransferase)